VVRFRPWPLAIVLGACAAAPETEPSASRSTAPLALAKVTPLSTVHVEGAGALDFEGVYLPQVVCCENGAAPPEALKAQAVMARSYATFSYFDEGVGTPERPLTGTTRDQAYFCKQPVSRACREAVAATAGEITAYANTRGARIANVSFYVDGPRPACLAGRSCTCPKPAPTVSFSPPDHPPDCECFTFASPGAANPAYVTYNWTRAGEDVTASRIGSLSNESNRGCGSQNIQSCLGYAGWSYRDMLKVFYGQDIEVYRNGADVPIATPTEGTSPAPSQPASEAEAVDAGCHTSPRRPGDGLAACALGMAIALAARRRRHARVQRTQRGERAFDRGPSPA